ncbi:MAG: ABC transporter permease, partial [Acetatifactor sp.]|nr:ABC transporter permease [Acetatifactor sp.]
YNRLLTAADLPALELDAEEAAVYMDSEFTTSDRSRILNRILETEPEVFLAGDPLRLTGTVQTTNLVTDRSITLSFALILPDETFEYYTQGDYSVYLNGILSKEDAGNADLMSAISDMNRELSQAGLSYESYLQNMGRQLFYMVASSYITIYLAIIFLIIANTVIGVQFLMSQQKSGRRYQILIRLGAAYDTLCRSARKQINWYFGLPAAVAVLSSLFGVRALLTGILSSGAKDNLAEMMIVSAAMILTLCVIEYIYMAAVKRSSDRYLLSLMVPEREE